MRTRSLVWGIMCLLCLAGVWLFWHREKSRDGSSSHTAMVVARVAQLHPSSAASSRGVINTNPTQISLAGWNTNKFAGRLSNTLKPVGELVNDRHAILLENAFIDTQLPLNFVFPKNLQPQGDPGAYIVQARSPIDNAFRAMLAQAGATVVSYIPNDAYLVRATAGVAGMLGANPQTQAVIPYEPYYKIQPPLLPQAVGQMDLPDKTILILGLFTDDAPATIQQIEKLGGQIVGHDQSPFGPVVRVIPPRNWTALATLSGLGHVELYHPRAVANDLARPTLGVAADSLTPTNYLGLTGTNIIVEVNDTGIDALHPDLMGGGNYGKPPFPFAVIGDAQQSLMDTNGHGTHVAGIIAGDGAESMTVTNAPGSTLNNGQGTNFQFRGMAPGATLYSVGGIQGGADTNIVSDQYFQEVPALTNALISNNSWVFEGDNAYDLSAASYDAAVRDALPFVTGSQPVLFVFAAGNAGNGDDTADLGGGIADSIESPATAKNVITVGAIQENRDITATVTNADGSVTNAWQAMTSTSYRVAGFSSRGNVGIGTEGEFGRYKPDVCAPGTFIISTRSEQWDIGTYFFQDPTNNLFGIFTGIQVQPGTIWKNVFPSLPTNTVQATINIFTPVQSPFLFTTLPIFVGLFTSPGYDFFTTNNAVSIPPDGGAGYLQSIFATEGFLGAFQYGVSNNTSIPLTFDLLTDVITTNGSGDYFLVLSNLDQTIGTLNPASTGPGPYYRFETGTSMATPMVSGTLALMQEFYAKAYGGPPSPAMLKAMLVNGARTGGFYDYQVQNSINYEGWGVMNLPNSLPPGITNQLGVPCSTYVQDQNPANALATGDSQTWFVTTTNGLPMRFTLAWTDPPGDPAAAIKLVNNLVLVVTNLSNPTNTIVYYGNDIPASSTFNNPHGTGLPPHIDSINNVQMVNLPQGSGTSFSVTVSGFRVNVNAVTAQSNNVVQDYALVVSCGNGQASTVMTVTANTPAPISSLDQQIDFLSGTNVNAPLINEFVGANTPLLGTNTVPIGTITVLDTNGVAVPAPGLPTNGVVTVGMPNQWHFYVVTNSSGFTNAAFVVFNPNSPDPDTLSIPRMGVFTDTVGNASREADIDLYVTTDSTITNLNPSAISKCVHGTQVGLSTAGPTFNGASLGRGGTEFVVDIGSQGTEVYYIGVKSEDQMAAEYGFISIFSATPFSAMQNGNQEVNGVPIPAAIPDGSPAHPGKSYVFGLAIYPITVGTVTVSSQITHQNFGDLIGTLTLNGSHGVVLNNHDSFGGPPGPYDLLYDDSAGGGIAGSRPSDGPGSLNAVFGEQGIGVWQLSEVDDSLTQTGRVDNFNLTIQPRQDLGLATEGFSIPPGGWFYGFVDVPPGSTNLTVVVTNVLPAVNPPLELFVKLGSEPTTNSFDIMTVINNPGPGGTEWGTVTLGPPLTSGRYFVGIFNPSGSTVNGQVYATVGLGFAPAQTIYNSIDTPIPILDDAVTTDSINVPDHQFISSMDVAISVQHPRISDLVFHLIGPDGTRELLMENRGGLDPNGAGGIASVVTNVPVLGNFDTATPTNYTFGQPLGGSGWDVIGNPVSVVTDATNAYKGTNLLALANGTMSATFATVPGQLYTLNLAYRGPGIVSWWRGESNTFDSIGGNNGNSSPQIDYTNAGEVGSAFFLNNTNAYFWTPANPSLDVGTGGGLTLEGWINVSNVNLLCPIAEWNQDTTLNVGVSFWINQNPVSQGGPDQGVLVATVLDPAGTQFQHIESPNNVLFNNTTQHVAFTYNHTTGWVYLYVDGVQVTNYFWGFKTLQTSYDFWVAHRPQLCPLGCSTKDTFLGGMLDEFSLYNRALSDSEIQAIHQNSTRGKFDSIEFTNLPPQSHSLSLAEAQISLNGSVLTNLLGSNSTWQAKSISFVAGSSATTLQIQGVEPGMLLDSAGVVSVQTNYNYLVFTENTNLTTTPIKFAIPPFGPLAGYVQWPLSAGGTGHWYKAVVNPGGNLLSWAQMNQIAYAQGGYLATILSAAENSFVYSLLGPQFFMGIGGNGSGPALGGTNAVAGQITTDWRWETGEPWGYTAWQPGLPNNFAPACVHYLSGANGVPSALWDDIDPNDHNIGGYVIERNSMPGFNLPEQPLDGFDGLNAQGTWTLEVQDDRVGATNPAPLLLSWQLRFTYVTTGTNVAGIPPGTPETNVIPAGGWQYFPVNVPPSADWATNLLIFATGPLNMWFNPTNNPVGATPPDYLLLGGSTAGSSALSISSSPTNIVPGTTYYIGLQNTNTFPVTNGFQVNFHLIPPPISLTNGVPITNTITSSLAFSLSGHSFGYYSVTVPPNVDFVTNTLIFATQPVNLWFNQNGPPNGTSPPNYELLTNSTGGVSILSATSIPQLAPGLTYYLAIQNTNGVPVTNAFVVNFHYISTNPITGPGITITNNGGTNGFLVQWSGSTNYQYGIQWKTNLSPVFPWNTVTNPVINVTYVSTNGNYSWFDDGSLTGGWPPQKFYRVVATLPPFVITDSTPFTNNVPLGALEKFEVSVPTNATAATNILFYASGPVDVYFNQTGPPNGNNPGSFTMLSSATSGSFVLDGGSLPPLVPGATYNIGIKNLGPGQVTFVYQVNFGYGALVTNPPPTPGIIVTNIGGTNAVLLTWVAPTNYQFQVQWATSLTPASAWHTISNVAVTWSGVVSPTNATYGFFQFLDDGSLTGGFGPWKFYRLIEYPYSAPIPQTLTIINTAVVGNAVQFQWVAPTNYQYQVLWTTNLALPLGSWSVLANPVLGLSNGVYIFTDTNQTGPPTYPKFFRVLEQ